MPTYIYSWEETLSYNSSPNKLSCSLSDKPETPFPSLGVSLVAEWASNHYPSSGGTLLYGLKWTKIDQQVSILGGQIMCVCHTNGSTSLSSQVIQLDRTHWQVGSSGQKTSKFTSNGNGSHYYSVPFLIVAVIEVDGSPPKLPFRPQGFFSYQDPNNVEFVFPRESISLWTNATFIKGSSPYIAGLLTSTFSEGNLSSKPFDFASGKSASPSAGHSGELVPSSEVNDGESPEYFDDSDSEDTKRSHLPKRHQKSTKTPISPRHLIKVTGFEAVTYLAVLTWVYSGNVKFATLRSKNKSDSPSDIPLTSPKSVYRLCHFLEIESLGRYALENYKSQLSVECAASELYSNLSGVFEEVRKVALDFACAHWKEVKASEGMKKVVQEINEGKRPFAASIGAELAMRL